MQMTNTQLMMWLDWFERHIFGAKAEKRDVSAEQMALSMASVPAGTSDAPKIDQKPADRRSVLRLGARRDRQARVAALAHCQ